jgi:hypothetical protein
LYNVASGGNIFWIKDNQAFVLGKFDAWGCEIRNWKSLHTDEHLLKTQLRPLAAHGVNCVGLRLQNPEQNVHFFNYDGTVHDDEKAERFTKLTGALRNHYLGTVVNLFSADPRCYLESAEAYRKAVKTTAALLPRRHSVVFVLGDIFGPVQWKDNCPFPMDDPQRVVALARLINRIKPKAMIAVPSTLMGDAASDTLLYVTQKADALQKAFESAKSGKDPLKATGDVTTFPADQFLMQKNTRTRYEDAVSEFQGKVLQTRLQKSFDPPKDLASPKAELNPEEKAAGFELLFDGQSLGRWTTLTDNWGSWSVRNGTIYCDGSTNLAWLRSDRLYDNFILRLEFKILQNGNSGLFLRSSLDGRASRFGMEMQIYGKLHDRPNAHETSGAIYDIVPPEVDAANPPGQWNAVEITCRGPKVIIRMNGKMLSDINMDNVKPLKNSLQRGIIGLQDHGCKVWFRNIRIKVLD